MKMRYLLRQISNVLLTGSTSEAARRRLSDWIQGPNDCCGHYKRKLPFIWSTRVFGPYNNLVHVYGIHFSRKAAVKQIREDLDKVAAEHVAQMLIAGPEPTLPPHLAVVNRAKGVELRQWCEEMAALVRWFPETKGTVYEIDTLGVQHKFKRDVVELRESVLRTLEKLP
jgi:hypothetical protein